MHQADPKSGDLSFELLAEIAVGHTARVEICRVVEGPLDGELVAVKRLHPHIADDPQFVDMFRDEVWMTAALKHVHVVEVVGWGQDAVGPWLAVEFVRGVSLQRLMKTVFETGERFSERMVVYLARCICDGLAAAHDLRAASGQPLNLVHRDLTPGNILLGFDGQVKITDFGLAKAKQRLTKTLTGLLKGQPQYMSPEQVQGQALDGRSDVFALGVVLFELFGGRRPWNAATDLDAMRAITDESPGDLLTLRPRIDKALVDVVNRCLDKDRDKRWQSAAELRDRFDEWLNAHGYRDDNHVSLARFVRRNAMRQMRWFERAVAGEFAEEARANQSMPLGRVSAPPPEPPPPATPSTSSTARTREHTATRDERPVSARQERLEAPPRAPVPERRLPARTRLTHEGAEGRPSDSIDWGDDGPTLVQRSEDARLAIRAARRAKERANRPSAEPTIRRNRGEGADARAAAADPSAGVVEGDDKELPTVPDRSARREPAGTIQLGDVGGQVASALAEPIGPSRDDLGVVAPPDPEVPPPPLRSSPPSPRVGGPEPDKEEGPRPKVSGRVERASGMVDATGATRPLSVEEIERSPMARDHEVSASDAGLAAGLRAMPAPRFPSLLTLSDQVPSMDVTSEARRLGEVAKRAAELAEVAARASKLAGEAAILAADGERHEAIAKLMEAQRIERALERGEMPSSELGELPEVETFLDRPWMRRLQSREGMMVMLIAAVGLGLSALVLAIVV